MTKKVVKLHNYKYDVIFEDDKGYLLESEIGERFHITEKSHYTEVKEPRKFSGWINLWDHGNGLGIQAGSVHESRESALKSVNRDSSYIDTIEINYTEKV